MTGKIRIVRVLGNPKKPRRSNRKKKRKVKRRRKMAPHTATRGGKFLIQAMTASGRIYYMQKGGSRFDKVRASADRFATVKGAENTMRKNRAHAEGRGFKWLQVVAA